MALNVYASTRLLRQLTTSQEVMETSSHYFKQSIVPQWEQEQHVLQNIQQIIEKLVKAETVFIKSLSEIQKLRLKDSHFDQNQGLLSLQVTLTSFVSSLAAQHSEIVSSINDDILSDIVENLSIQKTYRSHYSAVVEEKRKAEASAVSRYNKLMDAYATIVEDSTDRPSEEDIQASYAVCSGAFDTLSQQREANQVTFQTICDNYCRIRYNNLSIAASCIRKLLVYMSSATANTQFDIQSISAKLNGIPSSHTYQDYQQEIHIPSSKKDPIFLLTKPEPVENEEYSQPVNSVRCYSEETHISQVPLEEAQCYSDEPVEGYTVPVPLLSISLTLLRQIKGRQEELDPSTCRSVSSLFLSGNINTVDQTQQQLQNYIDQNPLGAIHTAQNMITMMMFTDGKKLKKENKAACISIIQKMRTTGTVPEDVIDVLWKAIGMEE